MSVPVLETGLVSQRVISEEIGKIHASAAASGTQPRLDFPPYRSAACVIRPGIRGALTRRGPSFRARFRGSDVDPFEADLTTKGAASRSASE